MEKIITETEVKKTCYSEDELAEFREIILKKIEKAQESYKEFSTMAFNENNGHETSRSFEIVENAKEGTDMETTLIIASRLSKHIQDLKNALLRIENKTYGICRNTGKLISKERLRIAPHATLCIDAKLSQNPKN